MPAPFESEQVDAAKTSGTSPTLYTTLGVVEAAVPEYRAGHIKLIPPRKTTDDRIQSTGTTDGGKVRRRMRSRFQKGCIQKSGDWVVVRFRVDTPVGRELKSEKVCPCSDPELSPRLNRSAVQQK